MKDKKELSSVDKIIIRSKSKQILSDFEKYLTVLREDREEAIQDYENLKSEYGKEEHYQQLEKEIKRLKKRLSNSLCEMSQLEKDRYDNFKKGHYEKCNNGSRIDISLTFTGVGTSIQLKCPICGETKDITDLDCW